MRVPKNQSLFDLPLWLIHRFQVVPERPNSLEAEFIEYAGFFPMHQLQLSNQRRFVIWILPSGFPPRNRLVWGGSIVSSIYMFCVCFGWIGMEGRPSLFMGRVFDIAIGICCCVCWYWIPRWTIAEGHCFIWGSIKEIGSFGIYIYRTTKQLHSP